ncbi:MAG: MBL fold metallo-hydrolase [Clostridiales bacterium]|nr:MBL fold metallo-hydrolase [Clostridiales bacterium]
MTTLHTLSSGSEGNSLLLSCGDTHLLIDAGISCRRIKTALSTLHLTADDLSAVCITHEHSDHVCGLTTLIKNHPLPVYASSGTARALCERIPGVAHVLSTADTPFSLGTCHVTPFSTSHDTRQSVDYRIDTPDGSVGVLTDTGYVTEEASLTLRGVALLILESNHDVEWLSAGPYPYYLKKRILSERGHLSNDAAADFAVEMAAAGTQEIVLAHLSRENNTPVRAYETVHSRLSAAGYAPRLSVAPRGEISECYCVEGVPCRK